MTSRSRNREEKFTLYNFIPCNGSHIPYSGFISLLRISHFYGDHHQKLARIIPREWYAVKALPTHFQFCVVSKLMVHNLSASIVVTTIHSYIDHSVHM